MKKIGLFVTGSLTLILLNFSVAYSQQNQKKVDLNAGADFYSSYLFRGTRYGKGPSVQPSVKMTAGGLTAGVWGSFDVNGYTETDPYILYSMPFGLSLGFTDYHYPGLDVFDISKTTGSHAVEFNSSFTKWGLTLSANYVFNKAGGAGSCGSDIYLQAGYQKGRFNVFAGAGNGWYTHDNEFDLCNVGFGVTKSIEITDKFSVPVNGQVIVNPDRKQAYMVVGFSF